MKVRKLVDSFNYAIEGLFYTFRTQRNMKIHFFVALLVLIAAMLARVSRLETIILFITISMVFVAEMINTSIETVVDMMKEEYHPLAAIAKNVAAGAVLVTSINALVVGYIIFYDKISSFSFSAIHAIKAAPVHLTAVSLIVVVITVIIIKAFSRTGTFLYGGMPSGHSALAFSLFTSITLLSGNALVAGLSMLMAVIVLQSRIEKGIHNLYEIITGALLGMLLTVLVFQLLKI